MESISSVIPQTNTQKTPADASTLATRPQSAEVFLSPEGDSIRLKEAEYRLTLANPQQRQALITANAFIVNQIATTSEPQANPKTELTALGTPLTLKLPEAMVQLALQKGISAETIATLAARPQGYPLPNVTVTTAEFQFANGTTVPQDAGTRLSPGEYLAKIALFQGQTILVLTPVQSKLEILIGSAIPETELPNLDKQPASVVVAKAEPANILATFLRKLEAQPFQGSTVSSLLDAAVEDNALSLNKSQQSQTGSQAQLKEALSQSTSLGPLKPQIENKTEATSEIKSLSGKQLSPIMTELAKGLSVNSALLLSKAQMQLEAQTAENSHKDISVNEVLQKAFNRAGTLPIEQPNTKAIANLAAELLKHLPQLSPTPLGQLSDLDQLKENLLGLAALNLTTPQLTSSPIFTHANAIASLFQLLLGVRANTNSPPSQKLANYLEQLQAKTGLSSNLLGQLAKAGGNESMGQLASSLHVYQQASNETNGNMTWFFALPYDINQRHEQLEGKFEQEANKDENQKVKGWQLQLKFNLAQGPLLIAARYHQQTLDVQFKGNSQELLNRVDGFLSSLEQKLSQLGFTPGEFSTQIAQVPATLLPGDHFLVKTKA